MRNYTLIIAMILMIGTIFSACSASSAGRTQTSESIASSVDLSAEVSSESSADIVEATSTASDLFTERDLDTAYEDAVSVTLADDASTGEGVAVDGNTVTITKEGTYLLSGTLTDGQILVDAAETAKIQLVLDNVSITCSGSAAIYVKSADKVFVTTAAGSENTLSSVGAFESDGDTNVDGTIFAKDDLTLNGEGSLTIVSEQGHGVVAKDDLKIASGTYTITAAGKGIDANDSVRVADGEITITSSSDAIHVENTEDTSKGYVYILNGTLNLTAEEGDGIDASGSVTIEDGTVNILAGGGYSNGEAKADWFGPGQDSTSDSGTSTKGIKSDSLITVTGGTIAINAADDAIHTNGDIQISGGAFTLASGDDGIHADYTLTMTDGSVEILTSHEGFEGYTIDIQGGSISLVSNDDGFNAAGSGTPTLSISGGTLSLNTGGDGLDSNGDLYISGGTVIVDGPASDGNGSMDYDGEAVITGGTVIALGSSGMAQNFSSSSTQGCILVNCGNQAAGTTVTLTDASGNEILSYTSEKAFASVVLSAPAITSGQSYTLTVGSSSTTIEMTSLLYGQGTGMGGMGGRGWR